MSESFAAEKLTLLRQAFAGLTEDELRRMAELSEERNFEAGEVLCHEGEFENVFYIIADGEAAVTKRVGEEEGERLLRVAARGDLVGEMALIQNAPRAATVTARTRISALAMDKKDFETMLSRSPQMAIDVIRITLDRLRANDQMAIQELKRTNKILRQLDRNKMEFIQVTAHELRTPLTVLKGYVNLLKTMSGIKENKTVAEVVDGINKGAERMHEIVNMMLDVTRLDSETIKVIPTMLLMKNVVNEALAELLKPAAERNIQIHVECDEQTPMIYADPSLIQKAIYHVAVNAIKYTPDGGSVTVRVYPSTMEDGAESATICVQDTGIGLDEEHRELIFEKFYQVGDAAVHSSGKTSFKGGGPGLGLAIARGMVKAHGGKIWAESPGHDETKFPGSSFYVQLPVHPKKNA